MALALVAFLMLAVAAMVLFPFFMMAMVLREGIVVLRAAHGRCGKTVAKFNAPHAGNGKNGMGNPAFHAVPEGFSEADGDVFHHALHNAAQGVAVGLRSPERFRPLGRVLDAAHFDEAGTELGKIEQLFCDYACRNNAQRKPAAEMAAAARVVETAKFEVGREVSMARTGMLPELLVILAAGVLVTKKDGERRAGGVAVVHAGNNFRKVGLQAGRGAQSTCLAAGKVLHEIFHAQRNAGQYTIQGYADALPVGFAKNAYTKFIAKSVHSLSNNSLKSGKDLATQAESSMTTGASAPRAATLRAITMRWSAKEG